jgi:hypothetical protein
MRLNFFYGYVMVPKTPIPWITYRIGFNINKSRCRILNMERLGSIVYRNYHPLSTGLADTKY